MIPPPLPQLPLLKNSSADGNDLINIFWRIIIKTSLILTKFNASLLRQFFFLNSHKNIKMYKQIICFFNQFRQLFADSSLKYVTR